MKRRNAFVRLPPNKRCIPRRFDGTNLSPRNCLKMHSLLTTICLLAKGELQYLGRILVEVTIANPHRFRAYVNQTLPVLPLTSFWESGEVKLLQQIEFLTFGLIRKSILLHCPLVTSNQTSDHKGNHWVSPKIFRFPGIVASIEKNVKIVAHNESNDG